ncbi:LytR/AlgR family response regulator transcription factor [Sphingobacterium sp. Mn56C]|uniref:LytR/AlgR family response regulator transcription factor n=1 Tax=Sphingobacterium sp. Mn56C TaxID=3395261 RepID=UPI003BC7643B
MKISTLLIIEDEKPNADRLKRLLKQIRPQLQIVGVEDSIYSAVEWLRSHAHPDIIMMDVRLSDGLSFEIFNWIAVESPIIFTTAYDEYAVKAFKFNSIDYLLKPIEEEELEAAFERYESLLPGEPAVQTNVQELLAFMQPQVYRKRFLIPFRDGYKNLLIEDIVYFYSENGLSHARLADGNTEIVPQTLEELEKQLDPSLYFRANRQFIIHIDAIRQVLNYFNGKLKLELKITPHLELIVSREKAPNLKMWLDF